MADLPEAPREPQERPDEIDLSQVLSDQDQLVDNEVPALPGPSTEADVPPQGLEFSRADSAPNRLKPALKVAAGVGLLAVVPVLQVTHTHDIWKNWRASRKDRATGQ